MPRRHDLNADNLHSIVEFDSVFRVNTDLSVTDDFYSMSAPDVALGPANDVEVMDTEWSVLKGFTGQYTYKGAVMHPSEYIGGRLAEHILSTPGFYAIVEVRDENFDYPEGDPIGWSVAYREN